MANPVIYVVAALRCEAKPLIAHYQLKGVGKGPFPVYEGEDICLVVSGVGKVAAAAATGYMQGMRGDAEFDAWLNIGVAGHRTRSVGEGVLAHKVVDEACAQRWYPTILFDSPSPTETLITVDQPQTVYPECFLYDMEGAGFFGSAVRFSTTELIHCFKIISDNESSPAEWVSEKHVVGLIEKRLGDIDGLIDALTVLQSQLQSEVAGQDDMATFAGRWRLTVYQRHRLRRLLQRWRTLAPDGTIPVNDFHHIRATQEMLDAFQRKIEALPIRFD